MCTVKQSRHLFVITDDFEDRVDAKICENRLFTVDERREVFPHVSQSVLYKTATVQLQYRKICARWAPRMLTDEHKQKRVHCSFVFGILPHRV
jgi:hypothetical protein